MKKVSNIYYSVEKNEEKTLDIYIPDGDARAVFLYMHGGGLESGKKEDQARDGEYLSNRGIGFISVNYRMYPVAKYPEFICDAAEAVAWAVNNIEKHFGTKKLYVGGSSAGGYLSMMLCFNKKYYEAVGISNSDISGYFHDAGQPTAHFNVLKNSGIDPRRIIVDESAPIYHVGTEEKYPSMRFIVSDNDMVGRYEQTMLMLKTLEHFGYSGIDFKLMHGTHCEYVNNKEPDGSTSLSHMIEDFVDTIK